MRPTALLTLFATVLTCACGSAPQTEAAPPPSPPAMLSDQQTPQAEGAPAGSPESLAEAEAAFERARAELSALSGDARGAAPPADAADTAATQSAAPAPARAAAPKREAEAPASAVEESRSGVEAKKAVSPCESTCKAFSSLTRAKDAICRLEQPRGPRCERAESIVRDAEGRVQSCGCPQ